MEDRVDVDGIKVFYRVEGKGEPVILIHGNGLSHGQWKYNIEPMARAYTVYAPDLPGFGLSDKPGVEYSILYYVDFLHSFMDSVGISRSAIAGHSFGGAIAAGFAARHPERTSGLVLSNATCITPVGTSYNKELFSVMLNLMVRNRKIFCRPMFYSGVASSMLDDVVLVTDKKESRKAFFLNCQEIMQYSAGYVDSLKMIKAPTLVIWGQNDMLLPPSDAEKYHEHIRGSSVKLIDHCGHMPNVEKYMEFNDAILEFLNSVKN
jgi:pimeloyl-ACP methyl ester carboxylesterase